MPACAQRLRACARVGLRARDEKAHVSARRNRRGARRFSSAPASAPSATASRRVPARSSRTPRCRRAAGSCRESEMRSPSSTACPAIGVRHEPSSTARNARSASQRHAGIRMVDLRQQPARARVVAARLDRRSRPARPPAETPPHRAARSPCRQGRAASGRRAPAASRRPRRRRACAAASRHCRAAAPRKYPAAAASPSPDAAAMRCRPPRRAAGRAALAALRLMKTSRTSSRGRQAASISPSGSSVGMSLAECTARSIAPASSASSISLVNSPLPPTSDSGRSWMRSPEVRITSISIASSAQPCAARERRAHHARLRQRERAAARADAQRHCRDIRLRHRTSQC